MIIVSQDKKTIFNFLNIEFIEIAENKTTIRCQCKIDLNCWLGNYKTEERAKEVLQEIINIYLDCNEYSYAEGYGYEKNSVYYMPKD